MPRLAQATTILPDLTTVFCTLSFEPQRFLSYFSRDLRMFFRGQDVDFNSAEVVFVDGHPFGKRCGIARFHHSRNRICTIIEAMSAGGPVISGQTKTPKRQLAAGPGRSRIHVDASGSRFIEKSVHRFRVFREDGRGETKSRRVHL